MVTMMTELAKNARVYLLYRIECNSSCLTCSNKFVCITCGLDRRLDRTSQRCNCLVGFYDDNNESCEPCDKSCFTCSGPLETDCLSCENLKSRILNNSVC